MKFKSWILVSGLLLAFLSPVYSRISPWYISIDASGFLPLYTFSVRLNRIENPLFTWGLGINHFWAQGISLNAEVFGQLSLFNTKHYELDVSMGVVGGWNREGSFGRTPKTFWGLGLHLQVTPVVFKLGDWAVSMLSFGVMPMTDFSVFNTNRSDLNQIDGFALSVYLFGVGARYSF